ncbi:hypothetical protein ACJX0J_021541 [Zea mays]
MILGKTTSTKFIHKKYNIIVMNTIKIFRSKLLNLYGTVIILSNWLYGHEEKTIFAQSSILSSGLTIVYRSTNIDEGPRKYTLDIKEWGSRIDAQTTGQVKFFYVQPRLNRYFSFGGGQKNTRESMYS